MHDCYCLHELGAQSHPEGRTTNVSADLIANCISYLEEAYIGMRRSGTCIAVSDVMPTLCPYFTAVQSQYLTRKYIASTYQLGRCLTWRAYKRPMNHYQHSDISTAEVAKLTKARPARASPRSKLRSPKILARTRNLRSIAATLIPYSIHTSVNSASVVLRGIFSVRKMQRNRRRR